jgi:hypothetical protein
MRKAIYAMNEPDAMPIPLLRLRSENLLYNLGRKCVWYVGEIGSLAGAMAALYCVAKIF